LRFPQIFGLSADRGGKRATINERHSRGAFAVTAVFRESTSCVRYYGYSLLDHRTSTAGMCTSLAIIAVLNLPNLNHQRTAGDAKSKSGSRNLPTISIYVSLAARPISDWPGDSLSELAPNDAKLSNFHNPFTWIDVGECLLS
jgi:hypothetical protein